MKQRIPARWYFDLVSPFAYLHLKRFGEPHPALDVEPVPALFAGLLKRRDNKGPTELAPKRLPAGQGAPRTKVDATYDFVFGPSLAT